MLVARSTGSIDLATPRAGVLGPLGAVPVAQLLAACRVRVPLGRGSRHRCRLRLGSGTRTGAAGTAVGRWPVLGLAIVGLVVLGLDVVGNVGRRRCRRRLGAGAGEELGGHGRLVGLLLDRHVGAGCAGRLLGERIDALLAGTADVLSPLGAVPVAQLVATGRIGIPLGRRVGGGHRTEIVGRRVGGLGVQPPGAVSATGAGSGCDAGAGSGSATGAGAVQLRARARRPAGSHRTRADRRLRPVRPGLPAADRCAVDRPS